MLTRDALIKLAHDRPELRARLIPILRKSYVDKTASRGELPGKTPGVIVSFGIDHASGRFVIVEKGDDALVNEDRLSQSEAALLVKKWAKPGPDTNRVVQMFMLDMDPGERYASVKKRYPQGRDASTKVAHGAVALKDPDVMLYMIEPGSNASKFYEMKVVRKGQETPAKMNKSFSTMGAYVLMKRWGRLTDNPSTGRVDSMNEVYSNENSARDAMLATKQEKTRKGYQVTREYPIGLGSAGFGWGGQAACQFIPELRTLHNVAENLMEGLTGFADVLEKLDRKHSDIAPKLRNFYETLDIAADKLLVYLDQELGECHGVLRSANEHRAYGAGVRIRADGRGFSISEIPKDKHGQVYDTELLLGPPAAIALANQIGHEFGAELVRMTLSEAKNFVDRKIQERSRRPLNTKWHYYTMPD